MKRLQNFLWFLYECFAFYTLIVYALIFWIPFDGWLAGFMMMSFPVVMIIHVISVPVWYIFGKKKALLPIAMLLLGCLFLPRTFAFGHEPESNASGNTFSIMNYNTHFFMRNSEPQHHPEVKEAIEVMKAWVANSGADVLCMPEYYEDHKKTFNLREVLSNAGYKYNSKFKIDEHKQQNHYEGVIMYSKYPIISSRDTVFEAQNGMIQIDIKIRQDTVRVIGVHLYSMMLNLSKLANQKKMKGIKRESKFTFERMKSGFLQRSTEVAILESWIEDSPYPVIACGDFNEVPYGYVYGRLKKTMNNAFEEKGRGFGFTFKNLPYFIRIDHQFYTPKSLAPLDFETFKVNYSDHYPVMGKYLIKK
ncbi:endonuclease/exonuclease/phosphatase family protein [Dyadobacter luticola]|uniref:Endonuclease/exonuclease/phosphatase n=1 Tax=Dyadobacter luticola TaxID=1979387 RepID=A0A5R9L1X5_9BACT|nr:endonuclease/exonuclease/phosphatase family protein [Dyadobacter luticola]TLV02359.1 endonuclease/exonuclease/phosphatase [Dyadobacter luticola]